MTFAISVFPTPASPSISSGFSIARARCTAVTIDGSATYPCSRIEPCSRRISGLIRPLAVRRYT